MTTALAPTSDLVVRAWLINVVGFANSGPTLPSDESKWSQDGFIQFTVVAGSPDVYSPRRSPLIQFDYWAVSPGSKKAPWNQANALAEKVLNASYDPAKNNTVLTLGGNYGQARVVSTYFLDEPRRVWDQTNDAARFMAQMQMNWVAV